MNSSLPLCVLPRKSRKGRRKVQTPVLSSTMQKAIERFAKEVGSPEITSRGCRNFRDWLALLSHPRYRTAWVGLSVALGHELFHHHHENTCLVQEEVVRKVIRCVVKPRLNESETVVSTSEYRHATVVPSGNSLMSVFQDRLQSVVDDFWSCCFANSNTDSQADQAISTRRVDLVHEQLSPLTLEMIGRNKGTNGSLTVGLPSFRELTASLETRDADTVSSPDQ